MSRSFDIFLSDLTEDARKRFFDALKLYEPDKPEHLVTEPIASYIFPDQESVPAHPNVTRMCYLYRDAANYKCYQEVFLKGNITAEQVERILDCCESRTYFIPEQLGLPLVREWEITEDDHPYCELEEESFEPICGKLSDCDFSVDELVDAFESVKFWDSVAYAPDINTEEE